MLDSLPTAGVSLLRDGAPSRPSTPVCDIAALLCRRLSWNALDIHTWCFGERLKRVAYGEMLQNRATQCFHELQRVM